jgi:hypothetical protein
MNSIQIIVHWSTQNLFAAAAFVFGGTMLAVMLYRYFSDYKMLRNTN